MRETSHFNLHYRLVDLDVRMKLEGAANITAKISVSVVFSSTMTISTSFLLTQQKQILYLYVSIRFAE